VTNTNDSGPGSLRAAIEASDFDAGDVDRIVFNIPGTGIHTISLLSDLSANEPVIIDGRTQPGFTSFPLIYLVSGGATGALSVQNGSTIRALAFGGFSQRAISLQGNVNLVEGNYVGVNPATGAGAPNGRGVEVSGTGNVIGGTTALARNVISGNTVDGMRIFGASNVVIGNYIGTDVSGTADLGNGANGVTLQFGGGAGVPSGNQIGGPTAAERNILSGNNQYGLLIDFGTSGDLVQGNYIGTDVSGSAAIGNTAGGIRVNGQNAVIGGPAAGAGNLISGNGLAATAAGIDIQSGTGAIVQGNRIGTNAAGTAALANGIGVTVNGSNNGIGSTQAGGANVISGNTGAGVRVTSGTGNRILGNEISGNGALGIDLGAASGITPNDTGDGDIGPNNLQNFPILSAVATGVAGVLNSTPGRTFTIQFFANTACDPSGNGEGQTLLGQASVTTNASGTATIAVFAAPEGQIVTATATSSVTNDTSEFSPCVIAQSGPTTVIATPVDIRVTRPGIGDPNGLPLNLTVAPPSFITLVRPGIGEIGGIGLNVAIAPPPFISVVRPGLGEAGGVGLNVTAASPPLITLVRPGIGDTGGIGLNVTIAPPPFISVVRPALGEAGGVGLNVTAASPPFIDVTLPGTTALKGSAPKESGVPVRRK
jgi:parallel beta-helix repeat protein